ncbi:MAG: hypothetical protein IRZ16_22005 [Myxococcaceae bacterium]|nr:hypothetical protein [Myxococcaceae bacterium]
MTFARVVAVVATVTGLLAASPAEARFGKRSEPERHSDSDRRPSSRSSSSSRTHEARSVLSSRNEVRVHAVAPARWGQVRVRHWPGDGCGLHHHATVFIAPPVYSTGYVYVEPRPYYPPPPPPQVEYREPPPPHRSGVTRFDLGLTGQALPNGGMFGGQLRVDFERFGIDVRYDRMSLLAEDGPGFDHIHLADAALTYALLDGNRGRLRAHFGAYSAFAPDVSMVGPGFGLSTTLELLGPFTAELDGQLVLIPFTELDTHAGLGLKLGPVEGRAGMRMTFLNDQGRVDGTPHGDLTVGPYLGVALVL